MVQAFSQLVNRKFASCDGKNLRVQQPTNSDKQNALYNGWLHSVFVTGNLCFGFNGLIIWGHHHFPGSWNDAETCRELQKRLLDPTMALQDNGIITDSAFPCSDTLFDRIVTPLKQGETVVYVINFEKSILRKCHSA
ncbi:hypothetical protein BCR33DRAFT_828009 [Rhizoclosmatium globosum]|uniref:DDE Tnp4 domain-containing protein n=1 Tax=Rhizoclosmatium globosum TaxID=329046 RepID=A0A1Y2C073_9FUNG|nr:hypothetical protein BCR33DRAFT_828009 [Rhizoclosmatium globosum]|eukprot:ORY40411.1 hypothetical protein BCR33DRAFT_828009 [Rhizoclosmatium globosum]